MFIFRNGEIVLIPFFITIFYLLSNSPRKAFLNIYLPFLLLLPGEFELKFTSLIPTITFQQGILLAISFSAFFKDGSSIYKRLCFFDGVVFFLCVYLFFNDYGFSKPKTRLFLFIHNLLDIFLPYLLAKTYMYEEKWRSSFIKRVVVCLAFNILLFPLEILFRRNIYRASLDSFFTNVDWYRTQPGALRFGFLQRIKGPFSCGINGGIVTCIGFFLSLYYMSFTKRVNFGKFFSLGKKALFWLFVYGIISHASRGPWLGGLVAFILFGAGKSKSSTLSFITRLSFLIILTCLMIGPFLEYINPSNNWEIGIEQGSAMYRYRMYEIYFDKIFIKPFFGWGFNPGFIEVGTISTDSHYLYTALTYGIPVSLINVYFVLQGFCRALFVGLSTFKGNLFRSERIFSFSLVAIYTMIGITIGTVWLSPHTFTIYMLILALSEHWFQTAKKLKRTKKTLLKQENQFSYQNNTSDEQILLTN